MPVTDGVAGWVEISAGDTTIPAYVARPEGSGPFPAVVVGFEMFGVTRYVRGVADRLARAGHLAVVPDFYHRHRGPDGVPLSLPADDAGRTAGLELVRGLRRDEVRSDVQAVLDHLGTHPAATGRAAMLGLSAGGHIAYYAATRLPLRALVVFYPGWLTGTEIALSRPVPTLDLTPRLAELGTPVLFLLGGGDHLFRAEDRALIGAALRGAGVRHDLVVYPGAPHGFFCDERATYRRDAAEDAWRRTLDLLGRTSG